MPEDSTPVAAQHSPAERRRSGASGTGQPAINSRAVLIRRMAAIGMVALALAAGLYIFTFLRTGIWQILGNVGALALGFACLALARRTARRGNLGGAGHWMMWAILFAFGGGELLWSGTTVYFTTAVILMAVIVVSTIQTPRRGLWLASAAFYLLLYTVFVFLINRFEPLPRYDITQSPLLGPVMPVIVLLLSVVLVWQLIRAYQRIETIRVRLLVSLVLVVLLTVAAIAVALFVIGTSNGRRQAVEQLESVTRMKEAEIGRWVEDIQSDLDSVLSSSDVMPRVVTVLQAAEPLAVDRYWVREQLQWVVRQATRLDELSLVNTEGEVLVSSNPGREGATERDRAYFRLGLQGFYLEPLTYLPGLEAISVTASRPVLGSEGKVVGVLVGRIAPDTLNAIMGQQAWLGQTGELYLVDQNSIALTALRFDPRLGLPLNTEGVRQALATRTNGSVLYKNYADVQVVGVYHWLSNLQLALVAEQSQAEALSLTNSLLATVGLIALGALVMAVLASVFIARDIAEPLAALTETATRISSGDLALTAPAERQDEIGLLAQAFNVMTAQLRNLIATLEQRVADRTRNLQAAAEVGRATTAVLDPDQLLRQVVELVQERFDLYYVGLFLLDQEQRFAVLRAGTGEAGQQMLARGHKLALGGSSMIGQCVARNEARIALDVGKEAVRFDNPVLPLTRSEMALPLRVRGQVIGAMSVQSVRAAAFDESDIVVMQTMADQVAVAIDNARLFAESQATLRAMEAIQRRYLGEAWTQYTRSRPVSGYRQTETGLTPLDKALLPEVRQAVAAQQPLLEQEADGKTIALTAPIVLRGQPIGALGFKGAGEQWSADDLMLAEMVAEQLALAADNIRLLEETQRRAAQERLVSEVTARVRESLDVEAVLQTAAGELRQALGLEDVVVRLAMPKSDDD